MLLNKEILFRNYNVIIIPERGSMTKALKLTDRLLKICLVIFLLFITCIFFLLVKYFSLRNDVSVLYLKNQHLNSVQKNNVADRKKNENIFQDKLRKIEELENIIENKLSKSISFKTVHLNNINYSIENINKDIAIKMIDSNFNSLSDINNKLDRMLEKEDCIPSILPCLGHITSYFGHRKDPFNETNSDFHPGIDIACSYGTKVYASASGKIVAAGPNSGYGNEIIIDHNNGLQSIYGHNSKLLVHIGQVVKKGDLIGLSGSTGRSTGPHVHFEIRKNKQPIDPSPFIKEEIKKCF